MVVLEPELGLDRGAVDAVGMETLARPLREPHVLLAALFRDGEGYLDVHGRDDFGVGELPDVNVVAAQYAGEVLDILPDIVEVDVFGRGL